jgi:hypothetical protein
MATIVDGDILKFPCDLIIHQTNCTSKNALGLAQSIFKMHPKADTYSTGEKRKPGTTTIIKITDYLRIANLYGQYLPGKKEEKGYDRLSLFKSGLIDLERQIDERSLIVAFPFNIGCGLAGGNWPDYKKEVDKFAKRNPQHDVYIVKLQ